MSVSTISPVIVAPNAIAVAPVVSYPSGSNVPAVSSPPGNPSGPGTLANGVGNIVYTIAAAYLPQTASTTNVYRVTFNGSLSSITTSAAGNVTCSIVVKRAGSVYGTIAAQSLYIPASTLGLTQDSNRFAYSLSGIYVPNPGDILEVWIYNFTGASLSALQLVPSIRGCGIELVSTSANQVLIFS